MKTYLGNNSWPDDYGPRDWEYEDGFPPNKDFNIFNEENWDV